MSCGSSSLALAVLLGALTALPAAADWSVLYQDHFNRPMMGPNWRMLRGDWRIEDGRLRITRQWPSDSVIYCTVPVRYENQKAEMDVSIGEQDSMSLYLRSGEKLWGGGGINDQFGIRFVGSAASKEGVAIAPNAPHRVVLQVENGKGTVTVDGKEVLARDVPPARSEVNCHFAVNCLPNGSIADFTLSVDKSKPVSMLVVNTPEENRRATVEAAKFLDRSDAACGFQKAIDSLPQNGGAVILPEGTFLMRRHLHLRSNVTLRGQGPATVLQAAPAFVSAIEKAESKAGVHTVTVKDASGFKVGDAVCFGPVWGHPGGVGVEDSGNLGVLVRAMDGNTITLSEPAPPKAKTLSHWFPLLFARQAEFVEVSDLTLRGEKNAGVDVYGGFQTNPLTFGVITGARVSRVNVDTWKGDGISLQGGADFIVTDNTVTGVAQGFHPGTTTERFLWSRNVSTGNNACGLYFCWYNRDGVYYRNTLDSFNGYPDAGDVFNIIACNKVLGAQRLTVGYGGVYFDNAVKSISADKGPVVAGKHLYLQPIRYFVIAGNQTDSITLGDGTMGNIVAGNGKAEFKGDAAKNPYSAEGVPDLGLVPGAGRTEPVQPPKLKEPVLDGRTYYKPDAPDCGFQAALDELGKRGSGTLLLPAGIYPLAQPLQVSSDVVLSGQGTATVLCPAAANKTESLIASNNTERIAIMNLTLRGGRGPTATRAPAINLTKVAEGTVSAVDVRGWEGAGIAADQCSLLVKDCRVMECAGDGYALRNGKIIVHSSNARECDNGFSCVNCQLHVEGNIAGLNRQSGYNIEGCTAPLLLANNASYNGGDGILLSDVRDAAIVANLCLNSNQAGAGLPAVASAEAGASAKAGIHLIGASTGCKVFYNTCSDEQLHATQTQGIIEAKAASKNVIRFNITAPVHRSPLSKEASSLVCQGTGSQAADNMTETQLPSGSSVEALQVGWPPPPPPKK